MNFQKLKGGMIAGFAMTGLVASLGLGSGLAAVADMGGDKTSQPESTVKTAENCVWYMTGAPTNLELSPETGAKYDGSDLNISTGTLGEISIYSSGNNGSEEAPTACTFYADTVAPKLTWSIAQSNPKFKATYGESNDRDNNFDFDFDLKFDLDKKAGECDEVFTVTDIISLKAGSRSVVGIQIANVTDVTLPTKGQGQSCSTTVEAKTEIPEIQEVPASAGADYTWTGPTVTITGSTHSTSS